MQLAFIGAALLATGQFVLAAPAIADINLANNNAAHTSSARASSTTFTTIATASYTFKSLASASSASTVSHASASPTYISFTGTGSKHNSTKENDSEQTGSDDTGSTSTSSTDASSTTDDAWAAQVSPIFPNLNVSSDAKPFYNNGPLDTNSTLSKKTLNLKRYPELWKTPSTKSSEVQTMIQRINWDLVPKISKRKTKKGDLIFKGYNEDKDPDCWWSASGCHKPKVSYLPPDLYTCPTKGDWGLTYDDGPFNFLDDDDENAHTENPYAEPRLYNFLAKEDLKATLFYIGSNVATYPAAARRALSDGHTLCVHTWSHQVMTSLSNEKVVAELYWTLKAIKEATGVTPKCWRPPQGDVDDRVRSIAWQMGMRTVIWSEDTNDWNMPAPGGGDLPPSTVDGYFEDWIHKEKNGTFKEGIMVLEHELNHATVNMTEHWLPEVKKTFNVVSGLTCNNVLQPYWETTFKYPAAN